MTSPTPMSLEDLQALLDASPAIAALGARMESADPARSAVELSMTIHPALERANGTGQFHGGPLASLIDIAGDVAVAMMVGGGVPTIDLRIDYLRPVLTRSVRAKAVVRKLGRTIALADVEIYDDQGKLCVLGRGSYSPRVG
ncbi:MAG: PaaI family thioesterase [Gemmatimonadales bacterium]